ncbi:OsmC family protein [Spirochaeta thermophila]|uniref:OsmC family protein n=2 Tax=Winmispira thermophila TaxID=154 RepID=G0GC75_WINT7|nr:OsmC family protein [Spirochaeta thermophila]ADN01140.1 hypothetical protein STHERM_c01640 [Spirochaeta thermophila DSM 6192]AEJ60439.1 OsmC family protein [Spirochaeta thermophila DSM 6578]
MAAKVTARHTGDMAFDVEVDGHTLTVDAHPEFGGKDAGPRPKNLLLAGLAGCTGMDVVSILGKMRMPYDSFTLHIEADLSEEHPKVFTRIHLVYAFTGDALDREKIEKAVRLSQEKYCGVSAMLGKTARITYEIRLDG